MMVVDDEGDASYYRRESETVVIFIKMFLSVEYFWQTGFLKKSQGAGGRTEERRYILK